VQGGALRDHAAIYLLCCDAALDAAGLCGAEDYAGGSVREHAAPTRPPAQVPPRVQPIENFWGASKAYCRNNCDYTFSGLKETVPKALASVHLDKICKFERRCIRFMQVYKIGLPPLLAEFAVKKYTSHRHIPPENLMVSMEVEFEQKRSL